MVRPASRLIIVAALAIAVSPAARAAGQTASGGSANRPPSAPAVPTGAPVVPPTGTSAVSGVVTDGATHRPVGGAVVYLGIEGHGPAVRNSEALTDARGRFVFQNLPASDLFFMSARKLGYVDGNYGSDSQTPVPTGNSGRIALTDGQWFGEANITLWKPGAIGGRVVDERGEPVVGAFVRVLAHTMLSGRDHVAAGVVATTDDRGRYRLQGLLPGSYIVSVPSVQTAVPLATTPAEIEGSGARSAGSDARRNNGAIALDADHLLIIGNYATPPPPGRDRPQAYPMAFYPNAPTLADATPITVESGGTREGIDFTLQPVPTVRVSGHVDGASDGTRGLVLRLLAAGLEDLATGGEAATTLVAADGTFTFLSVPAGNYTIDAGQSTLQLSYGPALPVSPTLPDTPGSPDSSLAMSSLPGLGSLRFESRHPKLGTDVWGRLPVSVGTSDVSGLSLVLRPSLTMHGRFALDGTGDAPPQPTVFAEPADGRSVLGMPWSARPAPGDEGPFTLTGLRPGEYTLRIAGLNPRYLVESITAGGTDYTTKPFDTTTGGDLDDVVVTLTDRVTTIAGSVVAGENAPLPHAVVLIFPTAKSQWTRYGLTPSRIKTTQVSSTGSYRTQVMPAGSYYLVAIDASQMLRWQDPAFLESAAQMATTVTVGWGESRSQTLRLAMIK